MGFQWGANLGPHDIFKIICLLLLIKITLMFGTTGNTMDEVEYMGPAPGNVDILVYFTDQQGKPSEIRNVDLDKFGMFNVHDCVNKIATMSPFYFLVSFYC